MIHQARRKSTKIHLSGSENTEWRGNLPREGVVVGKFVPSPESLFSWVPKGTNLGCPGNLPGCPRPLKKFKRFVQKMCVFVFIFLPLVHLNGIQGINLKHAKIGSEMFCNSLRVVVVVNLDVQRRSGR